MSPQKHDPASPEAWLLRARSNLSRARLHVGLPPEVLLEDLCFDAQQAAEKAIKALLLHRGVHFPKTHSIVALLTLVEGSGLPVPEAIRETGVLTRYAVVSRYPGVSDEVSKDEYARALKLAEDAVQWVESLIPKRASGV